MENEKVMTRVEALAALIKVGDIVVYNGQTHMVYSVLPYGQPTKWKHMVELDNGEVVERDAVKFQESNPIERRWERFEAMVCLHDLTYDYSDDHRVWQAGRASMQAIGNEAWSLGDPTRAAEVWNTHVRQKLRGSDWERWYKKSLP